MNWERSLPERRIWNTQRTWPRQFGCFAAQFDTCNVLQHPRRWEHRLRSQCECGAGCCAPIVGFLKDGDKNFNWTNSYKNQTFCSPSTARTAGGRSGHRPTMYWTPPRQKPRREKSTAHITKPEIDFWPLIDEHSTHVCDKAVVNFRLQETRMA